MTGEEGKKDLIHSFTLESKIHDKLKGVPCMLGVDEAGRGPVLGPMVYATMFCPISMLPELKDSNFDDSKVVRESDREKLFENIKKSDFLGYNVRSLSPQDISTGMLKRQKYNLNAQAYDATVMLIKLAIERGIDVQEIYVDTVGTASSYQQYLSSKFPKVRKIVVEPKADAKYPVVSGASICAKVSRDQMLKDWEFAEKLEDPDREFGPGYPGGKTTKTWLVNNVDPVFGFPGVVRFSWGTAKKIIESSCKRVSWEGEDDEDEIPSKENFFKPKRAKMDDENTYVRAPFFKERSLLSVADF